MLESLSQFCSQQGTHKTYWIAYSGGLDSHVLLQLLVELRQIIPLKIHAIHVHHGLSPNADDWMVHCQQVCQELEVDIQTHHLSLKPVKGQSLEALAREERYAIFADQLDADDVLLTAHHQEDQAETFLLQLMRGAGMKGLSAMPEMKPFAKGWHGRPLLSFSREALLDYANEKGLEWVEDESNQCEDFSRNFLRHQVMPILMQRWPAAGETIARSAAHCAETQALLEEFLVTDYELIKGSDPDALSLSRLLFLSPARQRQVLRFWIEQQGYPLPSNTKMATIQQCVLQAASDRFPCVEWGNVSLRRHQDNLHLVPIFPLVSKESVMWGLNEPHALEGLGVLQARQVQGRGLRLVTPEVSVRFRQGGERIKLPGSGRRTLKNLLQEWGVPTWLRDRIPLLYVGSQLVSVVGYAIDEGYQAGEEEAGWEVSLLPPRL